MEPQLKKRISIPTDLGSQEREALASLVIEFIQSRTEKGKDVDGKPFAKYSESYTSSLDFKNAGKSASHVNLRLTDEMMNSIELIGHGTGYITIGFQEGTEANDKAVWNQRDDNGPSRTFLGIDDSNLERLVAKARIDSTASSFAGSLANALVRRILGG